MPPDLPPPRGGGLRPIKDKADAERDAAKREAQAESARAGAEAAEKRQQQNQ